MECVANTFFDRHRGLEPNEARVSELLNKLSTKLDTYEVILGKQAYLAGGVSNCNFCECVGLLKWSFAEYYVG
jgi:hypothetical protein